MRAWILVVLCPMVAHASPARVLILGGGAQREDAVSALRQWTQGLEYTAAQPAAGFPKVIESATVKGLKPGFHVVILGACSDADGLRAMESVRSYGAGAYSRAVDWPDPLPCPTLRKGWTIEVAASVGSVKDGSLTAYALMNGSDPKPGSWVIEARKPDKSLIELRASDLNEAQKHFMPGLEGGVSRAALGTVAAKGDQLIVNYEICTRNATTSSRQIVEQRFSLKAGKVETDWGLGETFKVKCE